MKGILILSITILLLIPATGCRKRTAEEQLMMEFHQIMEDAYGKEGKARVMKFTGQ